MALDEMMELYRENGPAGLLRYKLPNGSENDFGIEGYLVMLLGIKAPWRRRQESSPSERHAWQQHLSRNAAIANAGLTIEQSLQFVHDPRWRWNDAAAHPIAS